MLAPMAEISHRAFRELAASFGGCDVYYSEMISAGAFVNGGPYERWYADNAPDPARLVYQVVGGNADKLVEAAALLSERECLGIDVNMGCAAPAIVRTGGGVAWMRDADKAAALLARVRKRTTRRLSVKLRLGFDADFERFAAFCTRLEDAGVDQITVHPRTAGEKFRRSADWSYVTAMRERLRIPVAGNGDISSAGEMRARAAEAPGGAVMVGRLAARKPWVFAQAAGLPLPEKIDLWDTAARFLALLEKYQPPAFHISRARRFFDYFCENLTWNHYVRTALGRESTLSAMRTMLERFFTQNPEERYSALSPNNHKDTLC